MRTSRIPAEITSVEDRILGNLSLAQLMFLSMPAVIIAGTYFVLSPMSQFDTPKIVIAIVLSIVSISLAIRRDGQLLGSFILLRLDYLVTRHRYVADKNSSALRHTTNLDFTRTRTTARKTRKRKPPDTKSLRSIRSALQNATSLRYTRKGRIYVQVQPKS